MQYLTSQRHSAGENDEISFVKQMVWCSLLIYGKHRRLNGAFCIDLGRKSILYVQAKKKNQFGG